MSRIMLNVEWAHKEGLHAPQNIAEISFGMSINNRFHTGFSVTKLTYIIVVGD